MSRIVHQTLSANTKRVSEYANFSTAVADLTAGDVLQIDENTVPDAAVVFPSTCFLEFRPGVYLDFSTAVPGANVTLKGHIVANPYIGNLAGPPL